MDREFDCDFYFGEKLDVPIKKMDCSDLKGNVVETPIVRKRHFYYLKGLSGLVFRKDYDTFIATGEPDCITVFFIMAVAKLLGKKVVLWCHGWHSERKWHMALWNRLYFGLASKVMLYGDYSRDFMVRKGINPDKLVCIYNSLDYDGQIKLRGSLAADDVYYEHFGNNLPVLLYIGRIQKRKKLDQVIEAMSLLKGRGCEVNFVCIGKDDEDVNLGSLAASRGMEHNVWMYGPLYDEALKSKLIYNADLMVSPGNVGLSAIDSLMFGLPVITNDNFAMQMPEHEAVTAGVTGDFFKENDSVDLADKIFMWLKNNELSSREDIARKCFEVVDDHYNPHYQMDVIRKAICD